MGHSWQYIHLHWGPASGSPQTTPDLYLQEAIAAARRGVKVRILLSDAFLDPSDPKDNTRTVAYVNEIARQAGLDMQARIVKSDLVGIDKIHNKGVVVDGRLSLVSSVNWSLNSPQNNREVSLIIDNPAIAAYFTDLFAWDWFNGTPADYPLITEVDAAVGFVEIFNPTAKTVAIGGWTLSTVAGQWSVPSGTTLPAGKALVITRDLTAFRTRYGSAVTPVEIPGLMLTGSRDTLSLREGQALVDTVAWGAPQTGWNLPNAATAPLCRPDPGKDTNSLLDWTQAARGTPGAPGCGK